MQALEKHLAPRLRLTGGMDSLQKFEDFINSQSLQKDTDVLMLWRGGDNLDVGVKPPGSAELSEASYPLAPATAEVAVSECKLNAAWRQKCVCTAGS